VEGAMSGDGGRSRKRKEVEGKKKIQKVSRKSGGDRERRGEERGEVDGRRERRREKGVEEIGRNKRWVKIGGRKEGRRDRYGRERREDKRVGAGRRWKG